MGEVPTHLVHRDLVLRRWRVRDARGLQQAVASSIEQLRPWMPWVAREPLSLRERRHLVRHWRREWRRGGDLALALFLDGKVAGSCGLHRRIGRGGLELGYWVHTAYAGRGLATRAAAGLATLAFGPLEMARVEIHHDRANLASRRVPEKLGFALLGEEPSAVDAPGETGISCIWRMERHRWQDPFGWEVSPSVPTLRRGCG